MPYIQLIVSMLIWGTLGLFVLKTDMSAIDIAFFRCLIASLVLAPYCYWRKMLPKKINWRELVLVILGGVFVAFNWVLLFISFRYASITLGNVAYYVQPIFLLFLGLILFHEKIEALKWLFILISLTGVYFCIDVSQENLSMHHQQLLGLASALLGGLFYSIATIIVKKQKTFSTPVLSLIQFIGGGVVLLPFTSFEHLNPSFSMFSNILIIGLLHTIIAFFLYYESVTKLSTDVIAIVSYIDPIVAILTDVLFFNRHLSNLQIFGIILTLLGSYLVIQFKQIKTYLLRMSE